MKEFHGGGALEVMNEPSSSFLDKLKFGNKSSDMLSASAMQAHELAKWLDQVFKHPDVNIHLDVYVLHTRYSSVVTVGEEALVTLNWSEDEVAEPPL